jgi:hypothetical protein
VVGGLGVEVAQRAAEQRRLPDAGGTIRLGVRAAKPRVVQQLPDLLVPGD